MRPSSNCSSTCVDPRRAADLAQAVVGRARRCRTRSRTRGTRRSSLVALLEDVQRAPPPAAAARARGGTAGSARALAHRVKATARTSHPGTRRPYHGDDRLLWFTRDLRVHDHPALRAALDRRRAGRAGLLPRRPAAARPPRLRPAHAVHARVPARPGRRPARRADGPRHPPRPARARAARAGARARTPARVHFTRRRRARSPAGAPSGCARARRRRAASRIPACTPSTTSAPCARRPASPTRCSAPSTAPGSTRAAPRACSAAPRALPAPPSAAAQGPASVARGRSASSRRWSEPLPGGEAARAQRLSALPARRRARLRRQPRRARARPHVAAVALPALRLPVAARDRGAAAAGRRPEAFRRQLCWRDFHHHVLLHFPRNARSEFQERYRGDRLEPRRAALRGVVRGPDGLSAGRRRHAPAAARGLDAQPRAAGRRLVPDQGPGHRLALGRALVHAAADRRRRGQQQRQLAVDRVGRRRPPAVLPAHLQPGAATWSASTRDGDYVRRYVPELRDVPDEYLAEPWTMPDEVQREAGCVIGARLPRADRRPPRGPAAQAMDRYSTSERPARGPFRAGPCRAMVSVPRGAAAPIGGFCDRAGRRRGARPRRGAAPGRGLGFGASVGRDARDSVRSIGPARFGISADTGRDARPLARPPARAASGGLGPRSSSAPPIRLIHNAATTRLLHLGRSPVASSAYAGTYDAIGRRLGSGGRSGGRRWP